MNALIIDDELHARADLHERLAAYPEIHVVGEAATMGAARTALARTDYDLVFLDIQLRGGSGFDLVPTVRPEARIVFATAFDQYAVRAFEVNAVDYLLKPVVPARLAQCLRRLGIGSTDPGHVGPASAPAPPQAALPPQLAAGDLLLLKTGAGSSRFVALADIVAISACQNYTNVHLAGGETAIVRRALKAWEELLPAAQFVRVHRLAIASVTHVRAVARVTGDTSEISLAGLTKPLRASYRYLPALHARLREIAAAAS